MRVSSIPITPTYTRLCVCARVYVQEREREYVYAYIASRKISKRKETKTDVLFYSFLYTC